LQAQQKAGDDESSIQCAGSKEERLVTAEQATLKESPCKNIKVKV
jgi:hypothetical protein